MTMCAANRPELLADPFQHSFCLHVELRLRAKHLSSSSPRALKLAQAHPRAFTRLNIIPTDIYLRRIRFVQ
jgi:hypothetical protein